MISEILPCNTFLDRFQVWKSLSATCKVVFGTGDRLPGARDLSERGGGGREEGAPAGRQAQPCNVPPQNVAMD